MQEALLNARDEAEQALLGTLRAFEEVLPQLSFEGDEGMWKLQQVEDIAIEHLGELRDLHEQLKELHLPTQDQPIYPDAAFFSRIVQHYEAIMEKAKEYSRLADRLDRPKSPEPYWEDGARALPSSRRSERQERDKKETRAKSFLLDEDMPILFTGRPAHLHGRRSNRDTGYPNLVEMPRRRDFEQAEQAFSSSTPYPGKGDRSDSKKATATLRSSLHWPRHQQNDATAWIPPDAGPRGFSRGLSLQRGTQQDMDGGRWSRPR